MTKQGSDCKCNGSSEVRAGYGKRGQLQQTLAGVDLVYGEALPFIQEERSVDAAVEKLVELWNFLRRQDKDVLLVGYTDADVFVFRDVIFVVVDDVLIAVEG